jgi:NADPH-dependent 2,4-dienoyl-CoA reductase/sulfur reductase-like enzyme/peroxiredoxin family protein/rhodanese-related sulfurtransferase/TusA-related sulfurtransferase
MMNGRKIIIVGGVAGGASSAARLRRLDEQANIILLERGEYISFANCGLPYHIGGNIKNREDLLLQTPASFSGRFNVDVRVLSEAVSIRTADKKITVRNLKTGETYEETYDKLVLSMGAEPVLPPIEGIRGDQVFTLRTIPDTVKIKEYIQQKKPRSAVIVGGGFIGVEMAENLVQAGLKVTLVEMLNQVIAPIDYELACQVHRHMEEKGVRLMLGSALRAIDGHGERLKITLSGGDIEADMAIMAIGVKPETRLAGDAGIKLNERGAIITNDHMLTSDPDIYAVGDAVEITDPVTGSKGFVPLAGPANKQGRIAADNICGLDSAYKGTQGSSILKVFDLTVASTGINEKTAKRLGLNYDKSFTFSLSHAGYYPGAADLAIKVIFEKTSGRILGAQVVGFDGADKRCDVFATAIRAGMTAHDLTELELCYAPPFSSAKDPVNMAGYVIENLLTGKSGNYHWHDVQALPRDGSVTLLDVRTAAEYENGHIGGYMNIPLDTLRGRLDTLDKAKPVYVTCQVGLRAYVAVRILRQNGFEALNLSGGYRLYDSVVGHESKSKPTVLDTETQLPKETEKKTADNAPAGKTVAVNACGLQCPGPIIKLSAALKDANTGDTVEITSTDPAFSCDLEGFCRRTGNELVRTSSEKGRFTALIKKEAAPAQTAVAAANGKNIIVFSEDLDKAIAAFIIANTAAAMGRKVSMFFTFWGLNILRKPSKIKVKKDLISAMFGKMMPRGTKKLPLSRMNMAGIGAQMIRSVMKKKNVSSLEEFVRIALDSGVELIACSMSMDIMGIKREELIDGITVSGAAAMLAFAEESDMSLFI